MDVKLFKQAVWEKRKEYKRPYLTKSQLCEAVKMADGARENKIKLNQLINYTINQRGK
jgi:hypothetical protein